VKYDDGDGEELELHELKKICKPQKREVAKKSTPNKEKLVERPARGIKPARTINPARSIRPLDYVGNMVEKKIGEEEEIQTGTVLSYDTKFDYFQVKYEDGQTEALEWTELKKILA